MEYTMFHDNAGNESTKTAPIADFKIGKASVTALLVKELGTTQPSVVFPKEIYPEIVSLKIARGKKDPENSGTIGYIVHADGVLEELADKVKLSELPWGTLRESAVVIGYLSTRAPSYRVYGGGKLADMFGVTEEDDSL